MSTLTDRLNGVSAGMAVKVPCRVATTAAIALTGLQTIDGVVLMAGDRVLVKDQASSVDHGIYVAATRAWERAKDFDGSRDAVAGTLVMVSSGTAHAESAWMVDMASDAVIGLSPIYFISVFGTDYSATSPILLTGSVLSLDLPAARTALSINNVENKSSATIRSEITSSNVTDALTFTPVNKAGDTMLGPLVLSGLPSLDTQAASKAYVDSLAQGLQVKTAVACATTANITLSGSQTIDGVTSGTSRVLVKNQSTASQNGIYVSAAGAWTRATDLDVWSEAIGAYVYVTAGTANGNSGWAANAASGGTIGTTSLTWTQFSAAGSYSALSPIVLTGSQFSLDASAAKTAMSLNNVENKSAATILGELTAAQIATALTYTPASVAAMAASTGAGLSGFSHANTYAAGTLGAKLKNEVFVTDAPFNCPTDGVTNCTTAVQAALDYVSGLGGGVVKIPSGLFIMTTGITVPDDVTLSGETMIPCMNPEGTVLKFGSSVAKCVTLTTGGNRSASLSYLTVWRAGSSPPANSSGVWVENAANILIEHVFSVNHARCFAFKASSVYGISAVMEFCFTAQASEDHLWYDSWAELRIIGGRFGTPGAYDYNCNSYIRIVGSDTSGAAGIGPNTLYVQDVQFNQGNGGPLYFLDFSNVATPYGNQALFVFNATYVETLRSGGAVIHSDANSPYISTFFMGAGTELNLPNVPLFSLNAATSVGQMEFNGCKGYLSAWSLAMKSDIGFLSFIGGEFSGAATITGHATNLSHCVVKGTVFSNGVTFAGKFDILDVDTPLNCTVTATALSGTSYFAVRSASTGLANSTNRAQSWAPGIGTAYTPPANGYMGWEIVSNTKLELKLKGSDGTTRKIGLTLDDPPISTKKFTGTTDGAGGAVFAHGLGTLPTKIISVRGKVTDAGGLAYPVQFSYADNANVGITSAKATRPYVAYVDYENA